MNEPTTTGNAAEAGAYAAIQRLTGQSANCKLWSVALASIVLITIVGRTGAQPLVWATVPVALLCLADAAYAAQARRTALLISKGKVSSEELLQSQTGAGGIVEAVKSLKGITSFSVWPYYGTLAALVVTLGQTVLAPQIKPGLTPVSSQPQFASQSPQRQFPTGIPQGGTFPNQQQRGFPNAANPGTTLGAPPQSSQLHPNTLGKPIASAPFPQGATPSGTTLKPRPVTPFTGQPSLPPGNTARATGLPKPPTPPDATAKDPVAKP